MSTRRYAWRPDVPDHRDHRFSLRVPRGGLPLAVDPFTGSRVENQGDLGSCTGHASTTALEIVTRSAIQLSRLMAYYNGRAIEGNTRSDAGCEIRDVVKGLMKYGVARESLWPYKVDRFRTKPTPKAYADAFAGLRAGMSYQRLSTLTEVQIALASGLPVIFGFTVPESFESDEVARTGWTQLPMKSEASVGGHAVVAIGYDFTRRRHPPFVWVRNSWGRAWGIEGNFMMPVEWFTDPRRLTDDMWVIRP